MATSRRQIDVWYDKDGDRILDASGRAIDPPVLYYGEQALLLLRVLKSDLTAYTGFAADDVLDAAIDTGPGLTTAPMVETADADINVAGDWADADATAGKFSVRLDAYTTQFSTAIGTSTSRQVTFRLQARPAGETYISAGVQLTFEARGRVSLGTDSPAAPTTNYYNKTEADALLAAKADKTGAQVVKSISQDVAVGDFTDNDPGTTGYIDLTTPVPIHSIVLGWKANVTAGFTGDTSALFQVGASGALDRFTADATNDGFGISKFGSASVAATSYTKAATTIRVTVTGASDFTSIKTAANGAATITVYYVQTE